MTVNIDGYQGGLSSRNIVAQKTITSTKANTNKNKSNAKKPKPQFAFITTITPKQHANQSSLIKLKSFEINSSVDENNFDISNRTSKIIPIVQTDNQSELTTMKTTSVKPLKQNDTYVTIYTITKMNTKQPI